MSINRNVNRDTYINPYDDMSMVRGDPGRTSNPEFDDPYATNRPKLINEEESGVNRSSGNPQSENLPSNSKKEGGKE